VILPVIGLAALALPAPRAQAGDPVAGLGPPPGSYTIEPPARSIRIPFEVFREEIRMSGRINDQEVRMLVDNGALWDELLFFGSPRVDSLGLPRQGEAYIGGAGSGETVTADFAQGIVLSFEGLDGRTVTFRDQAAIITPYEPGAPNPWAGSEGQVSAVLFKNFAVELDFDEGIMTLVPHEFFEGEGRGTEIPITPKPDSGSWTLPGVLTLDDGRRLELDMSMDLGWDDPLAINTGQLHGIEVPPGLEQVILGYGAQGEIRGYHGTVRALEIGGYRFEDVAATYSTVEDGGSKVDEVMVGLGILSRFNVIFDYPGRRLLVVANRGFDAPFESPGPGEAERLTAD
jgi:hypothetical protein